MIFRSFAVSFFGNDTITLMLSHYASLDLPRNCQQLEQHFRENQDRVRALREQKAKLDEEAGNLHDEVLENCSASLINNDHLVTLLTSIKALGAIKKGARPRDVPGSWREIPVWSQD